MSFVSRGIHHITAVASDPQANLNFYVGVLGLRLVKKTVNFDDPATYHFYFGDDAGRPGTILTFFPWPRAKRGTIGPGSGTAVAFAVPEGALSQWSRRLRVLGVQHESVAREDGHESLSLRDPDGMRIDLVECPFAAARECWAPEGIAAAMALRGLHSAAIGAAEIGPTVELLRGMLGMTPVSESAAGVVLAAPGTEPGRFISVVRTEGEEGTIGAGSVHHIAFRAADHDELTRWRESLRASRHAVSQIMDRSYFNSIYFRSPAGLLLEIATDSPGFTLDEPGDRLGESLRLPSQYEVRRAEIELKIPRVRPPAGPIVV